ncbi:cytochrome P450 [Ceraceosorus guamensis]|uniref:Cytochrome P450 n=1 Tax=Ceraceosorus guamensis TaxID=1522189 RepID=A0A316W6U0_9BASI|nr:cytochrome P450 [Ceraceosorus guamensis]PWN45324.1 cytochrome P450 [Ceraceosorus guamensis]
MQHFAQEKRLVVTDHVALRHILVSRPYAYPKGVDTARVLTSLMGAGLLVSEGDVHKRQRRAIEAGMSPASIKRLGPVFIFYARRLRHKLLQHVDKELRTARTKRAGTASDQGVLIDMLRASSRATLDVLGHAAFGLRLECLEDTELIRPGFEKEPTWLDNEREKSASSNPLVRAYDQALQLASSNSQWRMLLDIAIMFFPTLVWIPIGTQSRTFGRAQKHLREQAEKVVEDAKADLDAASADADKLLRVDGGAGSSAATYRGERADLLASMMRANALSRQAARDASESHIPEAFLQARAADDSGATGEKRQGSHSPSPVSPRSPFSRWSSVPESPMSLQKATLADEEVVAQVSTFMLAGFETTSTQLTWTLLYLAENSACQEKMREELRAKRTELGLSPVAGSWLATEDIDTHTDAYGDLERELTVDELETLPYLDAVVREVLRLQPAVHTSSRVASEDDVIPVDPLASPNVPRSGVRVEKGLMLIIPLTAIGRDPELWGEDADKFRPERWIEARRSDGSWAMEGAKRWSRTGGVAFMMGPRACIGNRFAVSEMKALLSILTSTLHFEKGRRPVTPKRWLVTRPWDWTVDSEQAPLMVRRVQA